MNGLFCESCGQEVARLSGFLSLQQKYCDTLLLYIIISSSQSWQYRYSSSAGCVSAELMFCE